MNSREIIDEGYKCDDYSNDKKYFKLGEIESIERDGNIFKFDFSKKMVFLNILNEDIIRVVLDNKEEIDLSTTPAIINHNLDCDKFAVMDNKNSLIIKTTSIKIHINKRKFSMIIYDVNDEVIHSDYGNGALGWYDNRIKAWKHMRNGERFYGLGEKCGHLDKKGRKYVMWNKDVYNPHVETTDPLYLSIPFLISFYRGRSYGIYFDNSYKSFFDLRAVNKDYYSFSAEGGKLDYYFINGPTLKEVVSSYMLLTGVTPLPPKWSLGYHQSRYSYKTENEVKKVAEEFRRRDIPCDVIHLDIHYMDQYKVFTWDDQRFPDPQKLVDDLSDKGFKLISIIDPGIKKDPLYPVYYQGIKNDYFCKYLDGDYFSGEVWPGECMFPDFTNKEVRSWWGRLHYDLFKIGIKGIWNDMNEPSVFNKNLTIDENVIHNNDGDYGKHSRFHNLYALLENAATYKSMKNHLHERPFILSRSGFAGIQRYAAVWTGDNRSYWEHLRLSIPMLLNLNLSGVSFSGADVGGFTGDSNGELLVRWTQLGVFIPFFRNHCSLDCIPQHPWDFGKKYEKIIKFYIKLRYNLIEYIYNLFYHCNVNRIPVMKPLVYEYPADQRAENINDQFILGNELLVAPVCKPDTVKKHVYLPDDIWYNYWTDERYEGPKDIICDAPLSRIPFFIKGGSIIPFIEDGDYVNQKSKDLELKIYFYIDESITTNSYRFYEDDGTSYAYKDDKYNIIKFSYQIIDRDIFIKIENIFQGYNSRFNNYKMILKNIHRHPVDVLVNNINCNKWIFNEEGELVINISPKNNEIKIKFDCSSRMLNV